MGKAGKFKPGKSIRKSGPGAGRRSSWRRSKDQRRWEAQRFKDERRKVGEVGEVRQVPKEEWARYEQPGR